MGGELSGAEPMSVLETGSRIRTKFIGTEPNTEPGLRMRDGLVRSACSRKNRGLVIGACSHPVSANFLGVVDPPE